MTRQVVLRRAADADINEAFAFYAEQSRGLDIPCRLLDCLRETFEFLLRSPHAGRLRQEIADWPEGLRSWPVKGFESLLVFYREIPEGIEVIRVLHGARELQALLDNDETAGEEQL